MAIKWIGLEWCPDARDYRKEFVCDTDSDLAKLPAAPYGSTALVAATGKTCIVNASGQWIDTATGKVIPGAGVSNAPTGGTSGGSNAGNSGSSGSNSGGSGVSHWDDLDGKPFYDTRVFEDIKAEWDGNTNGRFMINYGDTTLYKISDEIPSIDELRAGKMTWNNGRSETFVYREIDSGYTFEEHDGGYVFPTWNGAIVIVVSETSQFADETGIYVANFSDYNEYIQSIEYKKIVAGELKTIDPAFLPAGVPYDTRKLKVIPPSTVSGTCVAFGNIKVADSVDFDISKVASMSLNVDGEMWLVDQPVETVRYDDMEHSPLFINTSDGWNFATYFENQAEADAVWDSDDPNPLEPGLYLYLDCDEGTSAEVEYSFTLCERGELNKIPMTCLPDGIPHIDEYNNYHHLSYDLLPSGVPYAGYDENGEERINPIDDRLLGGALKFQTRSVQIPYSVVYNGLSSINLDIAGDVYILTHYLNSSTQFAYSRNLITWSIAEAPLGIKSGSVVHGNGVSVAKAKSEDKWMMSHDGVSWSVIDMPYFSTSYGCGVVFAHDRFFAVGYNSMLYSFDAVHWYQCTLDGITSMQGSVKQSDIAYNGRAYVLLNPSVSSTMDICAYYSTDGVVWHPSQLTNSRYPFQYLSAFDGSIYAIRYKDGKKAPAELYKTSNGNAWFETLSNVYVDRIISSGDRLVALSDDLNSIYVSDNDHYGLQGTTVARVDKNNGINASIYYNNGLYIWYFPWSSSGKGGRIYTSTDLYTWGTEAETLIMSDGNDAVEKVRNALGLNDSNSNSSAIELVDSIYMTCTKNDPISGAPIVSVFKVTVDETGTLSATKVST